MEWPFWATVLHRKALYIHTYVINQSSRVGRSVNVSGEHLARCLVAPSCDYLNLIARILVPRLSYTWVVTCHSCIHISILCSLTWSATNNNSVAVCALSSACCMQKVNAPKCPKNKIANMMPSS